MEHNKIRLTESKLKKIINETISQILEYNGERFNNAPIEK